MSLRFTPAAATALRKAIIEAGGVEVFAIGEVADGTVTAVTVTCRGTESAVPALLDRPRTGQVVIHNHPSGDLRPSQPDMHLAGIYGDDGVGVVIVDSKVSRANWVVEPHAERMVLVEREAVEAFFTQALPRALPGFEPRTQQLEMALEVLAALNEDRPVVVEAGTGTGKSLAYLVPSALWALANDSKVVVSTFTKALQAQLMGDDLPVLARAGIEVRAAVLQGRNNYLCKRRLGLAVAEDASQSESDRDPVFGHLTAWDEVTRIGARADLPVDVPPAIWERVESDGDLTLRVRCPHYESCHYYTARRRAAAAHLVVVNHALLVADRSLKKVGAPGVLPQYKRLILDEAHHIEEAATGALASRLTLRGLQRATAPLLSRGRRRGAIERLSIRHGSSGGALDPAGQAELGSLVGPTLDAIGALRQEGAGALEVIRTELPEPRPLRMTEALLQSDHWRHRIEPPLHRLLGLLEDATGLLGRVHGLFDDLSLDEADAPPVHELARARRRLVGHRAVIDRVLDDDPETCRWIEPARSRRDPTATLNAAPVRVAGPLRDILWDPLPGTTNTSATLSISGSFTFWQRRVGVRDAPSALFPSPFDYAQQAVLALPQDLPLPDESTYMSATSEVLVEAVTLSHGGTFVLCTSYEAVDHYARVLRQRLPAAWPVLAQGASGREGLLRQFRENRRAVLVGTDAFWEGVSVRGIGLRQVIVPRLPFRVPTDPLHAARVELEQRDGRDPFRSLVLPRAALRLRQGFGRLIRSRADRGVVLMLDRRLHERTYGRVLIHGLPPARRLKGPWSRVHDGLTAYWDLLAAERRWARAQARDSRDP